MISIPALNVSLKFLVKGREKALVLGEHVWGEEFAAANRAPTTRGAAAACIRDGDGHPFRHAIIESDLFTCADGAPGHEVIAAPFICLKSAAWVAGVIDAFEGLGHFDVGINVDL